MIFGPVKFVNYKIFQKKCRNKAYIFCNFAFKNLKSKKIRFIKIFENLGFFKINKINFKKNANFPHENWVKIN